MSRLQEYRYYIVPVYVVVMVMLFLVQQKVRRSQGDVLRSFNWEVDQIWFLLTKHVYESRADIHDYDNSLDLLYANRKKLLESDNKNYVDHFATMRADVEYVSTLLQKELVEKTQLDSLGQTHTVLQQSHALYRGLGRVMTLLTVGLYKLWEPQAWR